MSIEVIGAGWGRTSTMSLKVALIELGLPCYHMSEVFKNQGHEQTWLDIGLREEKEAGSTTLEQWEEVYNGGDNKKYKATVDWPSSSYVRELHEAYPNAKIILTIRDPAKWFDSVVDTIGERSYYWTVLYHLTGVSSPIFTAMVWAVVWRRYFRFEGHDDALPFRRWLHNLDRDYAIEQYNKHLAQVRALIPPAQLLEFVPQDGFPALCKFLNLPEPVDAVTGEKKLYPNVNDKSAFKASTKVKRVKVVTRLGIGLLMGGTVVAWLWPSKPSSSK
jgi:hypothetical protein